MPEHTPAHPRLKIAALALLLLAAALLSLGVGRYALTPLQILGIVWHKLAGLPLDAIHEQVCGRCGCRASSPPPPWARRWQPAAWRCKASSATRWWTHTSSA